MKQNWRPGTMIYPLPAVLVSCGDSVENSNLLTVAWVGTVCTNPPMCYISIRPERYSYDLIKKHMQFTINLTTKKMAKATDWAGVRSGKDFNKWKETGLTPVKGVKVSSPYIEESPISVECLVTEILPLGSHHMFLAKVLNVIVDESLINKDTDALELDKAGLITYSHGHYYSLGEEIGRFGWSVKKKHGNK